MQESQDDRRGAACRLPNASAGRLRPVNTRPARRLAAIDPHPRRAAPARQHHVASTMRGVAPNVLSFTSELRAATAAPSQRPVNYVLVRIIPPTGSHDRSGQAAVHRRRPARRPWARHRRHEAGQRDRRGAGGRPSLLLHRLPARARCPGQTIEDVCARRSGVRRGGRARAIPRPKASPSIDRQLPGRLADHDDGRDPAGPRRARSCWPARRSPTGPACAARTRCAISAACSAAPG